MGSPVTNESGIRQVTVNPEPRVKQPSVTLTQVRALYVYRGSNFWLNSTLKEARRAAALLRAKGQQVRFVAVFDPVNQQFVTHDSLLRMGVGPDEYLNYVVMVQTEKGIIGYPPAMVFKTKLHAEALKGLRQSDDPTGSNPPAA